jgi:D-beta-D-heptose 7-phosphate kinase/D-beta-D-heptose 1-phosphate adenosyltransferase
MTELKITRAQRKFKILLIGDSCLDEYVWGTCDRLNPEAPVPILKYEYKTVLEGMAANVKNNLLALGCDVQFYTQRERIVKKRYLEKRTGYQLLRVDEEQKVEPFAEELFLSDIDCIVVSDYDKGFLNYDFITSLKKRFFGPILLDTKKKDLKRFEGIIVKINSNEFAEAASLTDNLIVTNGGLGATYRNVTYPAKKVEVFDVCGAGDTFLSALTYGLLSTQDMASAIMFANEVSAITVQHVGVYAPTWEDIDEVRRES